MNPASMKQSSTGPTPTPRHKSAANKSPDPSSPGKPKESGSRQQSHPGQSSQTGSPQADREQTRKGGAGSGPKPPGAK
jgi:hypothetical protein